MTLRLRASFENRRIRSARTSPLRPKPLSRAAARLRQRLHHEQSEETFHRNRFDRTSGAITVAADSRARLLTLNRVSACHPHPGSYPWRRGDHDPSHRTTTISCAGDRRVFVTVGATLILTVPIGRKGSPPPLQYDCQWTPRFTRMRFAGSLRYRVDRFERDIVIPSGVTGRPRCWRPWLRRQPDSWL